LQILYNQTTRYLESDFEMLYKQVRAKCPATEFVDLVYKFRILWRNATSITLPANDRKTSFTAGCFFENTELKDLSAKRAKDIEGVYVKTVAEKFMHVKKDDSERTSKSWYTFHPYYSGKSYRKYRE